MKFKQYILLVAITIGFVTTTYSQHTTHVIKNGFGLMGGISLYDITTDNFSTKQGLGWAGGLSATLDLPHKGYTVSYGMQFSESSLEISGRPPETVNGNEMLEFKLIAVQLGFTYHKKIFGDNFTIDLGPQLQYNGKLELKDSTQEGYYINGYNSLTALDIADISQFNVNGMIGASVGIGSVKIKAQYIYGFLNILDKLNDKNLNVGTNSEKFDGHQSMLVIAAMFTF